MDNHLKGRKDHLLRSSNFFAKLVMPGNTIQVKKIFSSWLQRYLLSEAWRIWYARARGWSLLRRWPPRSSDRTASGQWSTCAVGYSWLPPPSTTAPENPDIWAERGRGGWEAQRAMGPIFLMPSIHDIIVFTTTSVNLRQQSELSLLLFITF